MPIEVAHSTEVIMDLAHLALIFLPPGPAEGLGVKHLPRSRNSPALPHRGWQFPDRQPLSPGPSNRKLGVR